jgi:hypothetical protein
MVAKQAMYRGCSVGNTTLAIPGEEVRQDVVPPDLATGNLATIFIYGTRSIPTGAHAVHLHRSLPEWSAQWHWGRCLIANRDPRSDSSVWVQVRGHLEYEQPSNPWLRRCSPLKTGFDARALAKRRFTSSAAQRIPESEHRRTVEIAHRQPAGVMRISFDGSSRRGLRHEFCKIAFSHHASVPNQSAGGRVHGWSTV